MKFDHKKYTYQKPFGRFARHQWEIVGPKGAIHFHASIDDQDESSPPSCGLEIHYCEAPEYMKDQAPGQLKCWLTGGKCWHNGTSLYASETLWPMYKSHLQMGHHDMVFNSLEREYISRFEEENSDD